MVLATSCGSFSVILVIFQFLVFMLNQKDVDGFRIQIGHCPSEPPKRMADFDLKRYLGTWHQQKTDIRFFSSIGKCPKQTLSQNEKKPIVDVKNSLKFDLGYMRYYYNYVIEGFAKPVDGMVGLLEVNLYIPVIGWQKAPLWILKTDYENYSIAWSCTGFRGFFNIQTSFILSRTPTPSSNYTDVINEQLTELKLSPADFVQLDQTGC